MIAQQKRRAMYKGFPHSPASPITSIPHQSDTFVTTDKPASTHHNHPKFTLVSGLTPGFVHSMGFDKHVMTHLHHYSITQNYEMITIISLVNLHHLKQM